MLGKSFRSVDSGLGGLVTNIIMNNNVEQPKLTINKGKNPSEQIYVYNFSVAQKIVKLLVNTDDGLGYCELLDGLFHTRYENNRFNQELVVQHIGDILSTLSNKLFEGKPMYSKNQIKNINQGKGNNIEQEFKSILIRTESQLHTMIKKVYGGSNEKNKAVLLDELIIWVVMLGK